MEDSLGKRYVIKLISTVLIALINAVVQLILPQALTIGEYADYTYNLNVFTSVLSIVILSADGAFASKISKRLKEGKLVLFYGKFLLAVALILNIGITVIFGTSLGERFFPGQTFVTVILALNASFVLKLIQEVMALYDCYALTRISEPFVVAHKVLIAIIIYVAYAFALLSVERFYVVQIIVILLICGIMLTIFVRKNTDIFKIQTEENIRGYISEFAQYCKPLVVANIVTNGLLIISNWLLKNYGGDTQQAYYGVAWQLNTLLAYTFTPITALLQREYAVRVHNMESLRALYQSILKKTMGIVTIFACFIIINTDIVLLTLFGQNYAGAVGITRLIMVYTIFQAWGQVNGAMFTATERTSIYAKVSVAVQVCSLILILVFQIPNFIWPEGLGAIGIGWQKMLGNLISVALCCYFNCRYLGVHFFKECRISLMPSVLWMGLAVFVRVLLDLVWKQLNMTNVYIEFFVNGFVYCLFAGICLIIFPQILGFKIDLRKLRRK